MKKFLLILILSAATVSHAFSFLPSIGGKILDVTSCTCSGGYLLTIQEPNMSITQLVFQLGISSLYSHYNLSTGSNVLGLFTYGGVCTVYYGIYCNSTGSPTGTVWYVGTSK